MERSDAEWFHSFSRDPFLRDGDLAGEDCESVAVAVQGSVALATGLLRERTREVRLPDARRSGDDDVVVLIDPGAGGKRAWKSRRIGRRVAGYSFAACVGIEPT